MKKTFPTLYKKSAKGKISQWDIYVQDTTEGYGTINTIHGYVDGKKQHDVTTIEGGKNIGKKNETTPLQQALAEAESKWKKQKDKGYIEEVEDVDNIVYLPMLAQNFEKREKYIEYPCLAQRKLDGCRCLAATHKQKIILSSRRGKQFPHLEHLFTSIKSFIRGREIILDGELYSDQLTFQRVVGLVKKETLNDKDKEDIKKISYRIYDCILLNNPNATFVRRYTFLHQVFAQWNFAHLQLVENVTIRSKDDVKQFHGQFVEEGYEGIMLRNANGVYEVNKRSNHLQKFKSFQDDEFTIVNFEEGIGRAEGTVIWVCETPDKKKFKVRPRGTEEQRKSWFENGKDFIGQKLTVRFQEYSNDGIPRFPVGIAIRSYE